MTAPLPTDAARLRLGIAVRILRSRFRVSIDTAAAAAQMSPTTWASLEKGRPVRAMTYWAVENVLGLPTSVFMRSLDRADVTPEDLAAELLGKVKPEESLLTTPTPAPAAAAWTSDDQARFVDLMARRDELDGKGRDELARLRDARAAAHPEELPVSFVAQHDAVWPPAPEQGHPVLALDVHEILSALQGHSIVVRDGEGRELTMRLLTPDELLARTDAADRYMIGLTGRTGPGMSRARAEELTRPLPQTQRYTF